MLRPESSLEFRDALFNAVQLVEACDDVLSSASRLARSTAARPGDLETAVHAGG